MEGGPACDVAGEAGWLAGLPVLIKDLTDVVGVRTTYGSPLFADHVPAKSPPLVERIEREGGIDRVRDCATGMKEPPSLASEPGLQELSEPQGHLQKRRECVGVERDQHGTEHRGEGADYHGGVHHLMLAVDQL
jgi:hypothetical protein